MACPLKISWEKIFATIYIQPLVRYDPIKLEQIPILRYLHV